jgi:NTP pyrophosphatase (non-canonical NTP hydrolase)
MKDRGLYYYNWKEAIRQECERQIEKWGIQDHEPETWLMYLVEEVGEIAEAIQSERVGAKRKSEVVKEAVQAATLAVKIAEMYHLSYVRDQ